MSRFMDLFDKDNRKLAVKVLDYYDGKSKSYLRQFLDTHRKNALNKGMVPRVRNLTKEIVDKSGMLFSGRPPTIEVWTQGADAKDDAASEAAQNLFEASNWIEFFNNFDTVVRMLKTAFVLVQFDGESRQLTFTVLSEANCAVNLDGKGQIDTLIYFTGNDGEVDTYRVWTPDLVQDLYVGTGGDETLANPVPNPYGLVPVARFHDTNIPRDGIWNPIPEDLVEINDIYNLHITDAEYAIMHSKLQTLFTNAQIQGSDVYLGSHVVDYGSALGPRVVTGGAGGGFIAGPGEAVALDGNGESIFLDYKGPTPDIKSADEVIKGWVRDYARDWSVAIEDDSSGSGQADSGFKLIVKEMPNMELRKKRQRMMEAGFQRLYSILLRISEIYKLGLAPNTTLWIKFSTPELPVDEKSTEDIWSRKIKEGRSSDVEYFMVQQGLSENEAIEKVKQLAEHRRVLKEANATGAPVVVEPNVTTRVEI